MLLTERRCKKLSVFDVSIIFKEIHWKEYSSYCHIMKCLLGYPVNERPFHSNYIDCKGNSRTEGIGDYLLFAVAYQWISRIIYCGNPYRESNDYHWFTLKDFKEKFVSDKPVENIIQLLYNPNMEVPDFGDEDEIISKYINNSQKEPCVPFQIIPAIEDVNFDGNFDYAILSQSPNYTPASADYIIDVFREYINEI